jgi:lipopolysaccharide/colanic/teichoic acid biosynthesis glycosyltransferase
MIQDILTDDAGATNYRRRSVAPITPIRTAHAVASLDPADPWQPRRADAASLDGRRWYPPVKRVLDVVAAVVLLACLLPLFLVVAFLIELDTRGPVFYRQQRVGRDGRPFRMVKFRSMQRGADRQLVQLLPLNETDGPMFKLRCDPRVTRVGRVLRRLSIDELPQLFNVLLGDMSLVGPRPALQREVDQYAAWQRHRLDVLPGLTGLWQVSGRSDLSFEDGMALDLQYVAQRSLLLDMAIIAKTIPAILRCRGAY